MPHWLFGVVGLGLCNLLSFLRPQHLQHLALLLGPIERRDSGDERIVGVIELRKRQHRL